MPRSSLVLLVLLVLLVFLVLFVVFALVLLVLLLIFARVGARFVLVEGFFAPVVARALDEPGIGPRERLRLGAERVAVVDVVDELLARARDHERPSDLVG